MKKVLKLTLVVVCVMCSTSLFAQKFGRINTAEIISSMPEYKEAMTQLESYVKELEAQAETISVELNTKGQDFQKNYETMTEAVRQLKEKELMDLQNRLQEFSQMAQQDIQKKQAELEQPIQKKAMDAINEVSKSGGYTAIFNVISGPVVYVDEAQVTDIGPAVKEKLGIPANATPAAAPAAAN